MPAVAAGSSSSPSSSASSVDPADVLVGPPHYRLLRWMYQYAAAFPGLSHTREEVAALMEAQAVEGAFGATEQSFRNAVDEAKHRFSLRGAFECLTREEGLYDAVDAGLTLLHDAAAPAGMPVDSRSSIFHLTQLVIITAALEAARETVKEERDAGDDDDAVRAAASRFDEIMADLLKDQAGGPGVSAEEKRLQQVALAKVQRFCNDYRALLRRAATDRKSAALSSEVLRTYSHDALVEAVKAAIIDISRALTLPPPMLNLVSRTACAQPAPPHATVVLSLISLSAVHWWYE